MPECQTLHVRHDAPRELARSVLLGAVDIALLVAGPVLGIVVASRLRSRDSRGTDRTR